MDLIANPISAHVHLNEPGRTHWEGFWTGTRAAASGGITTLIDMPLNSLPPTTTVQNLETKRTAAKGQCHTDVGFWGGVIPGNEVGDPVLNDFCWVLTDPVTIGAPQVTSACWGARI